ncbi:MAG: nucleotidyltransferase domain-containing protein [Spartobacteria bacterium]|nr:nucleotidyltransferase domain-containing protein [Spartobacteria bacterium]
MLSISTPGEDARKTKLEWMSSIAHFLMQYDALDMAYLYGSFAKGTARKTSDIDIAVAGIKPLTASLLLELMNGLASLTHREIDLIDLQQVNGLILREAMQGDDLFCRNIVVREQLMKKLVYDQEDFMPLRRKMMERRRHLELYGHD